MKTGTRASFDQAGMVLLEALIAVLIFSMGVLAIVGMQTAAVRAAGDAKLRSDAALVANDLIGKMWVTDRTATTLQNNFQGSGGSGGTAYTAWYTNVQAALPGADASPPTVSVNAANNVVTVTVYWKLPSEPASSAAHNYTTVAQVK